MQMRLGNFSPHVLRLFTFRKMSWLMWVYAEVADFKVCVYLPLVVDIYMLSYPKLETGWWWGSIFYRWNDPWLTSCASKVCVDLKVMLQITMYEVLTHELSHCSLMIESTWSVNFSVSEAGKVSYLLCCIYEFLNTNLCLSLWSFWNGKFHLFFTVISIVFFRRFFDLDYWVRKSFSKNRMAPSAT